MAIYAYHLANSYSGNTQPISHHTVYKYHHYNELKVLKGHIKMCFCKQRLYGKTLGGKVGPCLVEGGKMDVFREKFTKST